MTAALTSASAQAFDVVDYDVRLTIDRAQHNVRGRETIRLRDRGDGATTITFPRNGIDVETVTLAPATPLVHHEDTALVIDLPAPGTDREIEIVVTYTAHAPKGLVFQPDTIHSEFFTCHWMICREEPAAKATFSLAVAEPADLTLVASGAPVGRAGVWREAVPSSSYLFGFALGHFSRTSFVHRGVSLDHFAITADDPWRRRAFADEDRMLDFFAEKAGRPLPQPFYRQVVVDGEAAQEMTSLSVLGRQTLARRLDDPAEDWLVAHEMAHQYWGNLVTCADWPHFWLNEGLTTFMVAAYKERRWGRDAYDRELALARSRHQAAIDAGFDRPLTFVGEYPSLRMKRAIVYSKAALFVARLREVMGDRAFWRALRTYTWRYAGGVATTQDFQRVFAAATTQDLSSLFDAWAYGSPKQ